MGLEDRKRRPVKHERQLVALYFGATGCGPCHDERLKAALGVLKERLTDVAGAAGGSLHFIGVALEADVDSGIAFLRGSTSFDEIVVGGGMKTNTAAVRYLVHGPPGYLGIPQIVIHQRHLRTQGGSIEVLEDREIARYLGSEKISAWVEAGATLRPLEWHA
jgi:hypothetical protein